MLAKPAPVPDIRIRYVLGAAGAVLAAALVLSARFAWPSWGAGDALALAICALSVAFVAATYAHFVRETWALYMVMAVLVSWRSLGTTAGLLALLLGSALAAVICWRRHGTPARAALALSAWHLGAFGLALLLVGALYAALGGAALPTDLGLGAVLALALAAVTDAAAALALLALLAAEPFTWAQPLKLLAHNHLLRLAAILIVVVLAPLLLHQNGLVAFALVQVLIALQIQRHVHANRASRALERRLQEFALLNSISQAGARTLVLDDVLAAVYEHTSRLIHLRGLYVALYNQPQDTLDFRLVIVDGVVVQWPSRRADARYAAEKAIHSGQPVHIAGADTTAQPPEPNAADLNCGAYLSLPLTAGSRALGAIVLLSADADVFTPEVTSTLQLIASQTALAVRNAVLFAQRSELVDGLSHINDSVQNVLFSPNREQALLAACQTALRAVQPQPGTGAARRVPDGAGAHPRQPGRHLSAAARRRHAAPGKQHGPERRLPAALPAHPLPARPVRRRAARDHRHAPAAGQRAAGRGRHRRLRRDAAALHRGNTRPADSLPPRAAQLHPDRAVPAGNAGQPDHCHAGERPAYPAS